MALLPFALLHKDDFEKKVKEHLDKSPTHKSPTCVGDLSPSTDAPSSSISESADSSPFGSECSDLPVTENGLERTSVACRWTADELVEKQILMEGEKIVLCGSILRRRFPLLRKNVLMLTNMPRLLVLDPSCDKVLKQIPLRSDDTRLVARGIYDFQVGTPDKIYDCYDANIGADVWKRHVQAARDKVKDGRFF